MEKGDSGRAEVAGAGRQEDLERSGRWYLSHFFEHVADMGDGQGSPEVVSTQLARFWSVAGVRWSGL